MKDFKNEKRTMKVKKLMKLKYSYIDFLIICCLKLHKPRQVMGMKAEEGSSSIERKPTTENCSRVDHDLK